MASMQMRTGLSRSVGGFKSMQLISRKKQRIRKGGIETHSFHCKSLYVPLHWDHMRLGRGKRDGDGDGKGRDTVKRGGTD